MEVLLKPSNFWNDINDVFIKKDGKTLKMLCGGNLDLYLDIFGGETKKNENGLEESLFVFNMDDECFPEVNDLYESIISAEVYKDEEDISEEDKSHNARLNKMVGGSRAYRDLVKDGIVEFYSDNIYDERANKLEIKKLENNIFLPSQIILKTRLAMVFRLEFAILGLSIVLLMCALCGFLIVFKQKEKKKGNK